MPISTVRGARRGLCLSVLAVQLGCGRPADPAAPVNGLYQALIEGRVTGAPSAQQLVEISPFLSSELRALLDSARAIRDAEAAAHPDDKPPFADGDLFTSLIEGPTSFELLQAVTVAEEHRIPVRFRDGRASPVVEWIDTVVVRTEAGSLVVADVVYGATWDFANKAALAAALRDALSPPARSPWVLEMTGIGPAQIGMTIVQAESLLGTARILRQAPDDRCGYVYFADVPTGISFMVAGDTLVRTNIDTTGFLSGLGFGVGSSEADVRSFYDGMVRVQPHPYVGPEGHYLVVEDPALRGFRMIFETDGRVVTSFRAGRLPEVNLIEGCS